MKREDEGITSDRIVSFDVVSLGWYLIKAGFSFLTFCTFEFHLRTFFSSLFLFVFLTRVRVSSILEFVQGKTERKL